MNKEKVKIAILGWGSLLWEPGGDFSKSVEPWNSDGPVLPVEFSRVSKTRGGALTLVIDPKNGSNTTVAWCLSKRARLEDAVADLRCREGTTMEKIGHVSLNQQSAEPSDIEKTIAQWAAEKKLDAVVWTALQTNFEDKLKHPFSIERAVAHIKALPVDGKVKAAEYIWKAPDFVRTPLRSALQTEPWFSQALARPSKSGSPEQAAME